MKYNFDEIIDRKGTASVKYDVLDDMFGADDIIPMWIADMDFKTPDFIMDAVRKRAEHEILGYGMRPKSYYDSIINWIQRKHQWNIKQEWIEFSPGIVPAINISILAYTQPKDKIVIQPPVYYPFFSAINDNDRELIENPLKLENGRYHIDFEDLENKLKDAKMLIISNPHNPGGIVWTKDELQKMGELAIKHNVIVLSDEIHCDLVFKPHKYTPLASISEEIANNTVSFTAPTKTFNMAGLATSSAIIPNEELRLKYNKILETLHIGMGNVFGTAASEEAYNKGDEWLEQLLDYVSENIKFSEEYINKNIPQIKYIHPEGTYLLWIDCSALNVPDINKFMVEKARVGLNEGKIFGTGGEKFMRINLACPKSVVKTALERIKKAVDSM